MLTAASASEREGRSAPTNSPISFWSDTMQSRDAADLPRGRLSNSACPSIKIFAIDHLMRLRWKGFPAIA